MTFYWHGHLPGVVVRLGADFDEFVQVSSGPLLRTGYLLGPARMVRPTVRIPKPIKPAPRIRQASSP
jgi:hypothetical protein